MSEQHPKYISPYTDFGFKYLFGREEGRKEGLAKGRAEGQAIIVRSMVQSGLDLNQIAKIINMSIADIERILNSN